MLEDIQPVIQVHNKSRGTINAEKKWAEARPAKFFKDAVTEGVKEAQNQMIGVKEGRGEGSKSRMKKR